MTTLLIADVAKGALGDATSKALTAAETQNAKLEVYRFRDPSRRIFYVAWLNPIDTEEVVPLHLDGVQAILDGSKTPEDVAADVQAAAASAKAETAG